jgi:hypothetical protein
MSEGKAMRNIELAILHSKGREHDELLQRHRKRIKKESSTKVSCMSTSKWTKLFQTIADSDIDLHGEIIKLIANDCVTRFCLKRGGLSNWRGFTDDFLGGPIPYKEIEWIFVPAVYEIARKNRSEILEPKRIPNNIHVLKELIDSLGQFEYDFDESGLKIYGYKQTLDLSVEPPEQHRHEQSTGRINPPSATKIIILKKS